MNERSKIPKKKNDQDDRQQDDRDTDRKAKEEDQELKESADNTRGDQRHLKHSDDQVDAADVEKRYTTRLRSRDPRPSSSIWGYKDWQGPDPGNEIKGSEKDLDSEKDPADPDHGSELTDPDIKDR